ncbi:putative Ariadne-1 protein [Rhizophagus clarus]|uniref:RBR-type E3 ubiquitin transferase n=1 Tax=Rhizophagus clarus TaxID=94130 RepID=A0A8H3R9C5_9GLOM|nr:putative Ariadne-1 protein [Rhizophagus clarus]
MVCAKFRANHTMFACVGPLCDLCCSKVKGWVQKTLCKNSFLLWQLFHLTNEAKSARRRFQSMYDISDEDLTFEDSYRDSDEDVEDVEDEDDYVDDDDTDLDFTDVVAGKDHKKNYEVDFVVHSIEGIVKNQDDEVTHVSNILGIQKQHTATLLRHFHWNKERLIDRFRYLSFILILCMANDCNVIVDEETIELIVNKDIHDRYRTLLNRTYVNDKEYLRWCPVPNCEYVIECHIPHISLTSIVPTVECVCTHRFCFGCGLPDHQPSICVLVKKWIKKCDDYSETEDWISTHTKECGKCHSNIEKIGGSNYMTCCKCKYEFCWVCMGPWSKHGTSWYNCDRYDEKTIDAKYKQAESRASLERYLLYYNRFANHEQSAKLDRELYNKTEKKMVEMQQISDLSWIEVQFLKKAVDILVQCRITLKWTYVFAFYLARNDQTNVFEDNQRDLEMAVEQLLELLEKPIEAEIIAELKQQILDKTVYVGSHREGLLEDTAKGLLESRWEFQVDIKN